MGTAYLLALDMVFLAMTVPMLRQLLDEYRVWRRNRRRKTGGAS